MLNFFKKVKSLGRKIRDLFSGKIDEETLEQLEELLYQADLGAETAIELTEQIRQQMRKAPDTPVDTIVAGLKETIIGHLVHDSPHLVHSTTDAPTVILIVGVNGNGKTTSVAKLAKLIGKSGKPVVMGAADTFRAAAIDQLTTWADRVGADIVKGKPGSDPSSVVFDAVSAGVARNAGAVILDTAGRLHTKTDLMHELAKIRRVCQKVVPEAPHETLLVIDATTGQNAIDQAKTFHSFTPITGLILTKLDGTARGGIVVAIQRALDVPVKFIGMGEGIDDLHPFDAKAFAESLFS